MEIGAISALCVHTSKPFPAVLIAPEDVELSVQNYIIIQAVNEMFVVNVFFDSTSFNTLQFFTRQLNLSKQKS